MQSNIDEKLYSENDIQNDIDYFLKKMGWTRDTLNNYLNEIEVPHNYYGSEKNLWILFTNLFKFYKKIIKKI